MLERFAASMLERLHKCLDAERYQICDRPKNRMFLADYGFTLDDQLSILRSLAPADCIKTEVDRDDPNGTEEYWFHKKDYDGISVYVKYKIVLLKYPDDEHDYAIIKSIHEDGY